MMNKIMEKYVLPTALGIAAFLYWQTLPRMKKHSYTMAAPTFASASTAAHTGVIQSPPPKIDSRRNPPSSSAQNQANSEKDPSVASRPSSHGGDMASTGGKQPQSTTKSVEQSKNSLTSATEPQSTTKPVEQSIDPKVIGFRINKPKQGVQNGISEFLVSQGNIESWQSAENVSVLSQEKFFSWARGQDINWYDVYHGISPIMMY